jgi:pimeloyl-ACP methyl ester carboxylesterase
LSKAQDLHTQVLLPNLDLNVLAMCSKALAMLFVLACPVMGQNPLTIGGHPFVAWNVTAPHVLMLYHGLGNPVEEYYALAAHFGSLGYAVVLPTDCEHDVGVLPMVVVDWVKSTVAGVQKEFAKGRPLAVLGHSMGGGAVMAAARFERGLAAYVAVHPAPILSGGYIPFAPAMAGPILFITGTLEIIDNVGFTSQWTSAGSYDFAHSPKGLINVKGHGHMAITDPSFGEMEGVASEKWLDCFARKNQVSCDWLSVELCKSADGKFVNGLEWCKHDPPAMKPLSLYGHTTQAEGVLV